MCLLTGLLVALANSPSVAASLAGVVDLHVHSAPDSVPRSIDDRQLAERTCRAGMSAVVLKNHAFQTAGRAQLLQQAYTCARFYGGIVLNNASGGINAAAVAAMLEIEGDRARIVWLPTRDAKTVRLFDAHGQPVAQLRDIFSLVAAHDLVLATGHTPAGDVLRLLPAARESGVQRILVTHALSASVAATEEDIERLIAYGAVIELVVLATIRGESRLQDYADLVRRFGADHFVLSSDLGQTDTPFPDEGLAETIEGLAELGLSDADLDAITRSTPARLLRYRESGTHGTRPW